MFKLLICEDESLERRALRIILQKRYPNIHFIDDATTGTEAVKLAYQHSPDIILMDITMPGINGIDAQKEIIKFLPSVKTVIITAYNDFSYAQQAIKHGVCDFLLKPIAPDTLYECINKLIGSMDIKDIEKAKGVVKSTDMLQNIITYIDYNYLNNLHLKEIADLFHLNEKYLSRLFKQKTGISITEYITKQKINRAKHLLEYTDIPVYQIALELNFTDASYFNKVFQKFVGMPPKQYRSISKSDD